MRWKRRGRRLLVTTNSELNAIEAAAISGLRKPSATSGKAGSFGMNISRTYDGASDSGADQASGVPKTPSLMDYRASPETYKIPVNSPIASGYDDISTKFVIM